VEIEHSAVADEESGGTLNWGGVETQVIGGDEVENHFKMFRSGWRRFDQGSA
jgi:hypothetical protein